MQPHLRCLQLTFAIIKPHAVRNPWALQWIHDSLSENRFRIVRQRQLQFTPQLAAEFYAEHCGKFFYNRLHTFMCRSVSRVELMLHKCWVLIIRCLCSGPLEALILAHPTAIASWRELMGPTKVFKSIYSHPECLRSRCGLTDTRNACHGSDSVSSVEREIRILFPEFDVQAWYATDGGTNAEQDR